MSWWLVPLIHFPIFLQPNLRCFEESPKRHDSHSPAHSTPRDRSWAGLGWDRWAGGGRAETAGGGSEASEVLAETELFHCGSTAAFAAWWNIMWNLQDLTRGNCGNCGPRKKVDRLDSPRSVLKHGFRGATQTLWQLQVSLFFGTLNPAQWIPVSIYLPAYMVVS